MRPILVGIYEIRNIINGKIYIGKSVDILRRFSFHATTLRKGTHKNIHLQSAWLKYGEKSFTFNILQLCSKEMLNDLERECIKTTQSFEIGYNMTLGGDGGALVGEALIKMANSHRGKKPSKDSIEKVRMALLGRPRPEWVREKISASKKGEIKSEEHKQKISDTLKGRKLSLETRKKMSATRKGKAQPKLECPHCHKVGGTTMKRWHFDRCKENDKASYHN